LPEYYLGLLSGTSADAIDAAIFDFAFHPPKLIGALAYPIPSALKQTIYELSHGINNDINQMAKLDNALAVCFGKAAQAVIKQTSITASDILAIGSHGQTIRHQPTANPAYTLQIGDPNIIKALTNITTVADFRRYDLAVGGQGAPLAPALHAQLFQSTQEDVFVVNIGGIANITYLPKDTDQPIMGFDTGPGNGLLDQWIQKNLGKPYDDGGHWAASGQLNTALLDRCLTDDFFKLAPPKSTGTDYFHMDWLAPFIANIPAADVQRTLLTLTARTIANAIQSLATSGKVLLCGGGVHNRALRTEITKYLSSFCVQKTDDIGIHSDWLEAMLFAWLARQKLTTQPGNLPSVTGATKAAVLGGIY